MDQLRLPWGQPCAVRGGIGGEKGRGIRVGDGSGGEKETIEGMIKTGWRVRRGGGERRGREEINKFRVECEVQRAYLHSTALEVAWSIS